MKHLLVLACLVSACATTADPDDASEQDSSLAPSAATQVFADAVKAAVVAKTPQPTPTGIVLHSCHTIGVTPAIRFQIWAHDPNPPQTDYASGEIVVTTGGVRFVATTRVTLGKWSGTTYLNDDILFVIHRFRFSVTVNDGEGYAIFNRGVPIQEGAEQVGVRCTPAPDGWGA